MLSRHGGGDRTAALWACPSCRRRALLDPVRRAVLGEQVEERHGVERLGAEHARARQTPSREQLERDTGFIAVCQHDRLVAVLAHATARCRRRGRGRPRAARRPCPCRSRTCRRTSGRASGRRASPGSGSAAATTSRGATSTPRTRTGSVESSPSLCSVRSTSMNSSPSPYLNVTRSAVDPARHEQHLLVLDVHALDRADPSGKTNVSGSENGSVVYQPRSLSQITGGLRHSSIVVQIENVGAKS